MIYNDPADTDVALSFIQRMKDHRQPPEELFSARIINPQPYWIDYFGTNKRLIWPRKHSPDDPCLSQRLKMTMIAMVVAALVASAGCSTIARAYHHVQRYCPDGQAVKSIYHYRTWLWPQEVTWEESCEADRWVH